MRDHKTLHLVFLSSLFALLPFLGIALLLDTTLCDQV